MSLPRFSAVLAIACTAAALGAQQKPLTPHQLLARDIYKELVEINTSVQTGNITPAANAIALSSAVPRP